MDFFTLGLFFSQAFPAASPSLRSSARRLPTPLWPWPTTSSRDGPSVSQKRSNQVQRGRRRQGKRKASRRKSGKYACIPESSGQGRSSGVYDNRLDISHTRRAWWGWIWRHRRCAPNMASSSLSPWSGEEIEFGLTVIPGSILWQESPIQVLTKLNVAWLQCFFQFHLKCFL